MTQFSAIEFNIPKCSKHIFDSNSRSELYQGHIEQADIERDNRIDGEA